MKKWLAGPSAPLRPQAVWALTLAALVFALTTSACRKAQVESAPAPSSLAATQISTVPPTRIRPIVLPADDAPHPDATNEWWYHNGHLTAESGAEYSFHYAVFAVTAPGQIQAVLAHAALTSHAGKTQSQAERGRLGAVEPRPSGFHADVDGWLASGDGVRHILVFDVGQYHVELRVAVVKPPVLHKQSGWVQYPNGEVSAYYSRTLMAVSRQVGVSGVVQSVGGAVWFDHQWGNFDARAAAWDWFALQLDAGPEVVLSLVRDASGAHVDMYGTYIAQDGAVRHLGANDFEVQRLATWTSPASGAVYPMGWRVRLEDPPMDVMVVPLVESSEFDARRITGNFYWEGAVKVHGSHTGRGFVEMAGYAPRPPSISPSQSRP